MKHILSILLVLCCAYTSWSQVKTYPSNRNIVLEKFVDEHPNYVWGKDRNAYKFGVRDTLELPFFEDFSTSSMYPDSSKWLNNQVYVNAHFPIKPPTINVATFDVLDSRGIPYNNTINKDFSGPGDSLISQPINLFDSMGLTKYRLEDSIIFSFFYQPNGYGYHLSSKDSIRLFFKSKFGDWIQVWSAGGVSKSQDFKQVMIPIRDSGYMHKGFQFMFTTHTKQVGNANHWHIDYIVLGQDRSVTQTTYEEYAIQSVPTSLLANYNSMPFDHYILKKNAEKASSIEVGTSSLHDVTFNIGIRHVEYYEDDTLVNTAFSANFANLLPQESSVRVLNAYDFSTISSSEPIVIDRHYYIREQGVINPVTINDEYKTKTVFSDYFAHDDGSAEQGFGFDQNTNPKNVEGQIAYKFTLNKADSLYAIGAFFNQAVYDVSNRRFNFRVWSSLAGINGATEDVLIYESDELNPSYMQKINQLSVHYIVNDTSLYLPAGDFYIGWYQTSIYNLDIGWDMNCGNNLNQNATSPYLFYKVSDGSWTNDDIPAGELMLRPFVGTRRIVGIDEKPRLSNKLQFYPNPASGEVHFYEEFKTVSLFDLTGKECKHIDRARSIDVHDLPEGMYFIKCWNDKGEFLQAKLLIFAQ